MTRRRGPVRNEIESSTNRFSMVSENSSFTDSFAEVYRRGKSFITKSTSSSKRGSVLALSRGVDDSDSEDEIGSSTNIMPG